ncbi:MAG: maleylpyruvate isomerase N-terminal domain-containing protein [Anaerolineae bacterium]
MSKPQPIMVVDLFPEILAAFIDLLCGLSTEDWDKPTACPCWSVKDVALHLLGDDVAMLSSGRDGHTPSVSTHSWVELVAFINEWNEGWVRATRRVSPRLLIDLLELTGTQVCTYFQSLDPYAIAGPVSWAGPDPAPVWLDLAREYTERWHHQQHIRDAVDRPGLKEPQFFAPVLDTFVRGLPYAFRETEAADGTLVGLTISGAAGGQWFLLRAGENWGLYINVQREPHAEVIVDEDAAWRIFTRGLSKDEARGSVTVQGNQSLGLKVLDLVSIIA